MTLIVRLLLQDQPYCSSVGAGVPPCHRAFRSDSGHVPGSALLPLDG